MTAMLLVVVCLAAGCEPHTVQAPKARTERSAELSAAIGKGDAERVARLLQQDPALAHGRDADGATPLHLAARRDRTPIARLLLDAGSDVTAIDAKGRTPLSHAIAYNLYRRQMAGLLVAKGAERALAPGERARLLHRAATDGDTAVVEALLERGMNPRTESPNGGTLLHSAAAGGLVALARKLLGQGVQPDVLDRYGCTPLHYAAAYGQVSMVSWLLERGARIDAADPAGRTPLHLAVLYGRQESAATLRSRGARGSASFFLQRDGPYLGEQGPGLQPRLFASGIVSTFEWEHGSPAFSPDGQEVVWTSCLHIQPYCSVFAMTREQGRWRSPRPAWFSSRYGESYPRFSPDGSILLFNSYRPVNEGAADQPRKSRMWMATKTPRGWSEPTLVRFPSGGDPSGSGASLTNTGRFYFSMFREDGAGGFDIYSAEFKDGRFGEPRPVPGAVNTPGDESIPYVSPDERYMIFASGDRPENLGDYDLYVSIRQGDGSWGPARHLPPPTNGPGLNWLPTVSPDGRSLFFSSDRNGNIGDVFWVDARVIEK